MKPIIYALPPRLTHSNYLAHLHEALSERYAIYDGSLRGALWQMAWKRDLCIFHIHLFDEIIQRPQWLMSWIRMVGFIVMLMFLRWRGVHLIWTVHNLKPHICWHEDIAHTTVQHVINQCHAVTCHHAVTIPITVIPHGHCAEPFGPLMSRQHARIQLGLAQDIPVFVFLGMIRPYKGIDTAIAAMHAIPQAHIIIAGLPTDKQYLSQIHRQTANMTNVTVKPYFLPDSEAALYLAACDALLLPYRAITTSGMLVNAQAAGVVCVVPDLPPLAEQVHDGVNGFVYKSGSVDDLSRTLIRLLEHPQRDTIGIRAKHQLSDHTWDIIAKQFHLVYMRFFDVTAR
jgi:glycosyltransferase involved in cell wall biosynthesis